MHHNHNHKCTLCYTQAPRYAVEENKSFPTDPIHFFSPTPYTQPTNHSFSWECADISLHVSPPYLHRQQSEADIITNAYTKTKTNKICS